MSYFYPLASLTAHYRIEATSYGYILTGPKGAVYGLFRNVNRPEMLFPVSTSGDNLPMRLRGKWFKDAPTLPAEAR